LAILGLNFIEQSKILLISINLPLPDHPPKGDIVFAIPALYLSFLDTYPDNYYRDRV
jgi:hypothetical protein